MSLPYLLYAAGVICLVVALLAVIGIVHLAWPPWAAAGVILVVIGYLLRGRTGRPLV